MGGASRCLWEVVRRLAQKGHHVTLLAQRREDLPLEGVIDGVHLFTFDEASNNAGRLSQARRYFPELYRRVCEKAPPDVVHFHHPLPFYLIAKNKSCDLPSRVVYTFHSSWSDEHASRRLPSAGTFSSWMKVYAGIKMRAYCERWAMKRLTRLIVLSRYSADILQSRYGIDPDCIHLIRGAADLEIFKPLDDRGTVRERFGFAADERILLTVRRLDPRMGVLSLVKAFGCIAGELNRTRLVIGGSGPLAHEIRSYIQSNGLEGRIQMLGYVTDDDLPLLFSACDLFVLPTLEMEGFGLVTAEALAAGTPVIGTPAGATPEILADIDKDLLFASTDVEDMAKGLKHVLLERLDLLDCHERYRAVAEAQYNWDLVVREHEMLYQAI